jgi:hypothetical protein
MSSQEENTAEIDSYEVSKKAALEMAKAKGYNITSIKTFAGMEGGGFNATLCIGKKKIADFIDGGNGGMIYANRVHDKPALDQFNAELMSVPPWLCLSKPHPFDLELAISEMVTKAQDVKWYKRRCAKSVLFQLNGDKATDWRVIDIKTNPVDKVIEFVKQKHGAQLKEVANETRCS